MVFGVKDVAGLGLMALIAFFVIRGGRDLAGALGNITNPFENFSLPDINLGGVNLGSPSVETQEDVRDAVRDVLPDPLTTDRVQDVVNQNFSQVPPEQQTPVDALGAGLGGLFTGISDLFNGNTNTVPEQQGPVQIGPEFEQRPLDLTQLASPESTIPESSPPVTGGIFDTPIRNLSLSQIVDRFNVSASQAANIQAEAQNNFGDFDFGTNTGRGIGSIFTRDDITQELPSSNVSDERFTGLSPTEIAQRLTGGIIRNF